VICVLDADVVIASLDRAHPSHERAVSEVCRVRDGGTRLVMSVVNHAEVLVRASRDPDALVRAETAVREIGIEVVGVPPGLGRAAAAYRAFGVDLPDAFALATAQQLGASLGSFDERVRRALTSAEIAPAF
jgi:predicted nucleic acid-binding protein